MATSAVTGLARASRAEAAEREEACRHERGWRVAVDVGSLDPAPQVLLQIYH